MIFEYYHDLQLGDTLKYILKGIFNASLKNNVVRKENVHGQHRTAATGPLLIKYAKVNGSILRFRPWQNETQWSVNKFRSSKLGNKNAIW